MADEHVWTLAHEVEGQPMAPIDGAAVGEEVSIHVEVGERTPAGHRRFRLWLDAAEHGRSLVPLLYGQHPVGGDALDWVEVTRYEHQLQMTAGTGIEVPPRDRPSNHPAAWQPGSHRAATCSSSTTRRADG